MKLNGILALIELSTSPPLSNLSSSFATHLALHHRLVNGTLPRPQIRVDHDGVVVFHHGAVLLRPCSFPNDTKSALPFDTVA